MGKWRTCSARDEPFEDEARFRRATDGEYRWFLIRAVPLHDAEGHTSNGMGPSLTSKIGSGRSKR